ncbi:uncharacterized protein TRIVIDRAFT_210208 [Trichoderma virens Gv29-8]|uniref:Uncharacterized protein n=1 Tax=Hypocrea virens (strain Gv29-8 / FGSC 10586) TaxID=413071 RepID=G9N4M1_HYPVG|nr:uncharacterized protein TRIVIDRAFT_210208 [Trichoderma virens Gv29-8]EHK18545.1 hypothetical protein TRIVIDRAFT_210208 [Trichoderma virens Gv29-8]
MQVITPCTLNSSSAAPTSISLLDISILLLIYITTTPAFLSSPHTQLQHFIALDHRLREREKKHHFFIIRLLIIRVYTGVSTSCFHLFHHFFYHPWIHSLVASGLARA